jgi:hypothetical protein
MFTVHQDGFDVVMKGAGKLDLSGLGSFITGSYNGPGLVYQNGIQSSLVSPTLYDLYTGDIFSTNSPDVAGGSQIYSTSSEGAILAFDIEANKESLLVPSGYNGTELSTLMRFNGMNLSDFGWSEQGETRTWTLVNGDTIQLKVIGVPEPTSGSFLLAGLACAATGLRRRRT